MLNYCNFGVSIVQIWAMSGNSVFFGSRSIVWLLLLFFYISGQSLRTIFGPLIFYYTFFMLLMDLWVLCNKLFFICIHIFILFICLLKVFNSAYGGLPIHICLWLCWFLHNICLLSFHRKKLSIVIVFVLLLPIFAYNCASLGRKCCLLSFHKKNCLLYLLLLLLPVFACTCASLGRKFCLLFFHRKNCLL